MAENEILGDPYFQQALALAKGLAKKVGADTLSVSLILAGLKLARASVGKKVPKIIKQRLLEIEAATAQFPDKAVRPVKTAKLPLDPALKKILGAPLGSLEELVDALLKGARAAASSELAASANIADDPAFKIIMGYATAIAEKYSLSEISAEAFAAAALSAYRDDCLRERPGIAASVAANTRKIEAIILDRGWVIEGPAKPREKSYPLAAELKAAIEGDQSGNKLLTAINQGVEYGKKILGKRSTAYHEAGHAFLAYILRPGNPVSEVSIVGEIVDEGEALGVTKYTDVDLESRRNFLDEFCVALAGRVAEMIKFGPEEIDAGAQSDLEKTTWMAWRAIAELGLDPEFGPISLSTLAKQLGAQSSGWLFDRAQERLQQVLKEASTRTERLLRSNWAQVEAITAVLLSKNKISSDDLVASLIDKGLAALPEVRRARKRAVERSVSFAKAPGVMNTLEGPVRFDAEDAIITGETGEKWPVRRRVFERLYTAVPPLQQGEDGLYRANVHEVRALQLEDMRRIDLPDGRGLMQGSAGDWLLDYGDGDMSVVARDVFAATYEVLDESV